MKTAELERRLAAVEQKIDELVAERSTARKRHPIEMLESIHGMYEDDEITREAVRLGRLWRVSQRPRARKAARK